VGARAQTPPGPTPPAPSLTHLVLQLEPGVVRPKERPVLFLELGPDEGRERGVDARARLQGEDRLPLRHVELQAALYQILHGLEEWGGFGGGRGVGGSRASLIRVRVGSARAAGAAPRPRAPRPLAHPPSPRLPLADLNVGRADARPVGGDGRRPARCRARAAAARRRRRVALALVHQGRLGRGQGARRRAGGRHGAGGGTGAGATPAQRASARHSLRRGGGAGRPPPPRPQVILRGCPRDHFGSLSEYAIPSMGASCRMPMFLRMVGMMSTSRILALLTACFMPGMYQAMGMRCTSICAPPWSP